MKLGFWRVVIMILKEKQEEKTSRFEYSNFIRPRPERMTNDRSSVAVDSQRASCRPTPAVSIYVNPSLPEKSEIKRSFLTATPSLTERNRGGGNVPVIVHCSAKHL